MNQKDLLFVASFCAAFVGCADGVEVVEPIEDTTTHVLYSPSVGQIPVPNDLLYSGSVDGTLNIPVADPTDLSDPLVAINALEGWSTVAPFVIQFGAPIDLDSVIEEDTLRLFEVSVDTTIAPVGGPVTSVVGEVTSYEVALSAGDPTGATLEVRPTAPLAPNTVYMVVTTTGILDAEGEATSRSAEYAFHANQDIVMTPGSTSEALQGLVGAMQLAAAGVGIDPASITCSYTFTTQIIGLASGSAAQVALDDGAEAAIVAGLQTAFDAGLGVVDPSSQGWTGSEIDLASWTLADNGFEDTLQDSPGGDASFYKGSMDIPYYSDPLGPGNPAGEEPWTARFAWFDGSRNLTQFNPLPQVRATERIPVLVSIPNTGITANMPVTLFIHGIGANRTSLRGIADSLAAAGRVGIAIDLPLHGIDPDDPETSRDDAELAEEGTVTGELRERLFGIPSADSAFAFMNLTRLLVGRANLDQSVADITALRETCVLFDFDGDGNPDVDPDDMSFVGHSLGGIVGANALATHRILGEPGIAATLGMPGGGIARLLNASLAFGSEIDGVLASQEVIPGTAAYESFFFAAQTVIDAADPINLAPALAGSDSDYGIHLIEVVGNGVNNPADTVVPNSVSFAPLSGTDPLIAAMGLTRHDMPGQITGTTVQAYVPFAEGNHSSLVTPGADGPGTAGFAAFSEMQSQIAEFAATGGTSLTINDDSVIAQ